MNVIDIITDDLKIYQPMHKMSVLIAYLIPIQTEFYYGLLKRAVTCSVKNKFNFWSVPEIITNRVSLKVRKTRSVSR